MKKENGITLLALVITIIILLILAGISVAMITGSNGMIDKTIEAKLETTEAEDIEQIRTSFSAAKIALLKKADGNQEHPVQADALQKQILYDMHISEGVTVEENGSGFLVTMPSGNTYSVSSQGIATLYEEE